METALMLLPAVYTFSVGCGRPLEGKIYWLMMLGWRTVSGETALQDKQENICVHLCKTHACTCVSCWVICKSISVH